MRTRIIGGVLAATTAAALAAGCTTTPTATPAPPTSSAPTSSTGPSSSTGPVAAEHNAADVTFVQGMIPHHSQAITMADQAPGRAASPQVKDLSHRISAAQGPEIEQMKAMLAAWGAPNSGATPGMDGMSGMSGVGMMSAQQMNQLAAATGPGFDRMFLQMMIEHHQGAIQMAQTELAQGQNPQAKQLARSIINDQQAEISQMQTLFTQV